MPQRYDFSDPQAGKDICDKRTVSMKAHIRRWINEKHDVVTAQHMKQALESHGGLKGCRVAVVKIDPSTDNSSDNKIPGISLLNNFSYEYDGIRAWRSYNIGPGRNQLPSSGGEQPISDAQAERQPRGWALKATKKASRMSDKVKAYLVECFDAGVQSGIKPNPIEVAKELKLAKYQNGKTSFTPQEWRTSQQISSFFSRLSVAQRQNTNRRRCR